MDMTMESQAVVVKQLPEILSMKKGQQLFGELESWVKIDRPRIVLDCSRLRELDNSGVYLLLCCLEEAIKRNGDVKLASLSVEAKAVLVLTGADRLFAIFDTPADAVNSFHYLPITSVSPVLLPSALYGGSEGAV